MPLLHAGVGGPTWLDWSLHWDAVLLCLVAFGAYAYALRELPPRLADVGRVKRRHVLLFAAGVGSLYLAGGTPLHDLGEEYWLSAHMLQHLIFTIIAAPLLVAGVPAWLWEWLLLRNRGVRRVAEVLTKPVVAFGIFNALLVLTHLPSVVDLALRVGVFHFGVHAALVLAAMLMWWPVLSPLPQLPRLSYPLQMGYLFLQSLLPSVIASFVTFADRPVYEVYASAPRLLDVSALDDQQIAGGVMKLLGSIILWSFMGVIFFRWYGREEAEAKEPRWQDVEAELQELGLEGR